MSVGNPEHHRRHGSSRREREPLQYGVLLLSELSLRKIGTGDIAMTVRTSRFPIEEHPYIAHAHLYSLHVGL